MIDKINDFIALKLTLGMSSMWCVYLFFSIAILPLFIPSLEQLCIYLSTTIIQLVALPAILVGSKLLAKSAEDRNEKRAQIQFGAVMEMLDDIRANHMAMKDVVDKMQHIMTEEDTSATTVNEIKEKLDQVLNGIPAVYK